jgi:hypothetical protein
MPLEIALATFRETDISASDQVLYGSRYEAFARLCQCRDPRSDVCGDTAHIIFCKLDLPGVKPHANFNS